MNRIQGKGLAIAGSIVSSLFSLLFVVLGFVLKAMVNQSSFHLTTVDGMMETNPNITREEALQLVNESNMGFDFLANIIIFGALFFLLLGVIALVLSIKVTYKNKVLVGIILIVFAFVHIIFSRFLASILLLIAGILILSANESKNTRQLRLPEDLSKDSNDGKSTDYHENESNEHNQSTNLDEKITDEIVLTDEPEISSDEIEQSTNRHDSSSDEHNLDSEHNNSNYNS
ncbi:DUF4064 domain-containing protein [Haloplasma contractile]|uniref:DUF4064 domain-containing protein n=1 Tax=Haloplasma contractile SSD-17B TaxID=1033810 RepID=U2E9J9_9MOLU|nr:DUF4064 domain-containing protein [Haloplasma contractile]ERJ11506.1 hypothetical protein HLPCO_002418 [Haloplasma contractile SSD-17B]